MSHTINIVDGNLIISVPLDGNEGLTKGQKGVVLAKTGGFKGILGTDMAVNIMVYRKLRGSDVTVTPTAAPVTAAA